MMFVYINIVVVAFAGYSHKPEEFASIKDMSNGVKVLAFTLAKLSLQ
jgi:ureidoglycolate amidohydrolase